MATIKLYKNFSDAGNFYNIPGGGTIAQAFPEIDNWNEYAVICNGSKVSENYGISNNDLIVIRRIPGATAAIAIGIFSAGVAATVAIGSAVMSNENKKETEKLKAELEKLTNSGVSEEVVNLPYLRGSSNQGATGKTQPYIMGRHLMTPYILNGNKNYKGFSTIDGTDGKTQFYNVVLENGFNKQHIEKIYVDDITIKKFSGTDAQEGKYNIDAGIFASNNSFIEIRQNGDAFTTEDFNKKIVEKIVNEKLSIHDTENPEEYEDYYITLEENAMGVDVCILFNGLRHYLEDGTPGSKERNINVYYSYDYSELSAAGNGNNALWHEFKFDQNGTKSNKFTRDTMEQLRFNAHADFNYSDIFNGTTKKHEGPITIKVSTPDTKPTEGRDVADCYVNWVHSICYDTNKTKKAGQFVTQKIIEPREAALSTIIGVRIEATKANEDRLKSIQVITNGMARTWNGTAWSTTKTPTSNPAAWLLEVLTSSAHTPSQITDAEIDLEAFGEWFEFCAENNHTINYVISQGMTKSAIFEMLCETGRATMYRNIYGKISIAIDNEKENAICILNEQNLISFSYEKDIGRKVDGVKVTYIDAAADFQENTIIVMYDGSDPEERSADAVLTSVKLDGITNYAEAFRHTMYLMKQNNLRPRTARAQMGEEGYYYTPYSKVLVQHPALKIGLGNGEIKSLILDEARENITGLELYDGITLSSRKYNLIISCAGDNYNTPLECVIKAGSGTVYEVEFVTPIARTAAVIPHAGDIFSYGYETENITDEMLICGMERTENGYNLTLTDYDETIIDDSETLPEYTPDYAKPYKAAGSISSAASLTDLDTTRAELTNKIDSMVLENAPRYFVEFNSSIIKKTKDGSYSPATVTAAAWVMQGDQTQEAYYGKFHIYLNGESHEYIPASRAAGTSNTLEIKIADLLQDRNEITQIKIDFKNSSDTVLIDTETLPVISNSSVYSVVLENNYAAFICDENGLVGENEIVIKPHIYYGLTELPYGADGWEFASEPQKEGFTITFNSAEGTLNIKTISGANLEEAGNIALNLFIHSSDDEEIHIGYVSGSEEIYIGYDSSGASVEVGFFEPAEEGLFTTYFSFSKLQQLGLLLTTETDTTSENYDELVINGGKIKTRSIEAKTIKAHSITADEIKVGSITSEQINTSELFAKNITASDMHLSGNSTVDGSITAQDLIIKCSAGNEYTAGRIFQPWQIHPTSNAFQLNKILYLPVSGTLKLNMSYSADLTGDKNKYFFYAIDGMKKHTDGTISTETLWQEETKTGSNSKSIVIPVGTGINEYFRLAINVNFYCTAADSIVGFSVRLGCDRQNWILLNSLLQWQDS